MHQYLRIWRKRKKLSQEHVGNILGVRQTTIMRWEKGTVPLSIDKLEALATIYEISVGQLLGGPDTMEHTHTLKRFQAAIKGMDTKKVEAILAMIEALRD